MRILKTLLFILVITMTMLFTCNFLILAEDAHPVIQSITGPTSYTFPGPDKFEFKAEVKGGTPPYTYKWEASTITLLEGKGDTFANPTFTRDQVSPGDNGKGLYIRLYVTDSNGKPAAWLDEKGTANTLFIYAILFTDPQTVKIYPDFPYKSAFSIPQATPLESTDKPDERFAQFSSISGEVKYRPGDNENGWGFAKSTTKLYGGYHVLTGEDSGAIIGFEDLSTFKMNPETEVIITFPVKHDSKLALVGGTIWVNFKKMLKDGSMQVDLSQAVAGIKGTTFVCSELHGISSLKVIEGTVEYTSKINPSTQLVSTGEMLEANYNGLGTKTTFDIAQESKHWDSMKQASPSIKNTYVYIGSGVILIILLLVIIGFKKKK